MTVVIQCCQFVSTNTDSTAVSASFQYNCAKNGKGLKLGTKEADTTQINNRLGGISKD